jgi:hypothetical protein
LPEQLKLVGPQAEQIGFGVVPRDQILHVVDVGRVNDAAWVTPADDGDTILVAGALAKMALDQRG